MKRIGLCICLIGMFFLANAQQDPQFSQNMHNRLFPNPGVAGSNKSICATLLARHQWMGFTGKPETYLFSVHGPVQLLHGGVGLSVMSDKLGQENTFGVKLAYAFRLDIGVGSLGIGAAAGMVNKSIGNDWEAIDDFQLDPSINDQKVGDMALDFDFGAYYKTDKLYLGLSTTHLTESELQESGSGALSNYDFQYKIARHYYIMAGYEHEINPSISLLPSVFVKSDASTAQIDLNLLVLYNKMIFGGVSYRYKDAIVPMAGIYYGIGPGTLKFGYSYDVTTSILKQYSSGSHEVMLSYCFKLPSSDNSQKHKTVRFL